MTILLSENFLFEKTHDELYFKSEKDALNHVFQDVTARGYEINEEEYSKAFGFIVPKAETQRFSFQLTKNNVHLKEQLQVQLYKLESGSVELNYYIF